MTTLPVELVPAKAGFELVFAPTRSEIVDVRIYGPRGQAEVRRRIQELSVIVGELPDDLMNGGTLRIDIDFRGEQLELLGTRWFDTPQALEALADLGGGDPRTIYDARMEWANRDVEQAFMFELDRQSNRNFIRLATDVVPPGEADERIRVVDCLTTELLWRLRHRFWNPPKLRPPEVACRGWLEDCSAWFWKASDRLFRAASPPADDQRIVAIGTALVRFAAGDLRRTVRLADGMERYETDVDSFYVYMFAELAIACIDSDVRPLFWRPLLGPLTKMQRYYNARFDGQLDRRYVLAYDRPDALLKQEHRDSIDRYYGTRGPLTYVGALQEMEGNLHALAEEFDNGYSFPPRCIS